MSSAIQYSVVPNSHLEQLREGRAILRMEAEAISQLSQRLDSHFCNAVNAIVSSSGRLIVTGVGKAGLIGRKISATFASTGTPSYFIHPTEAVHGDLGCLDANDILFAISNSGETEEVCRLLPIVQQQGMTVIACTATETSRLGQQADMTLPLGQLQEAGPNALAPSTSTTAMLAMGDALALVVSRIKKFSSQDFAAIHPGGSLGAKLKVAEEIMRTDQQIRIAAERSSIREIFIHFKNPQRRSGAVMLTDETGQLTGLFTDSDLARLLEQRRDHQLDRPISEVMTHNPLTVTGTTAMSELLELLSQKKISELPVINEKKQPVGLIDITDVIGLFPNQFPDESPDDASPPASLSIF